MNEDVKDPRGTRSRIQRCECGYLETDSDAARVCYAHAMIAHGRSHEKDV